MLVFFLHDRKLHRKFLKLASNTLQVLFTCFRFHPWKGRKCDCSETVPTTQENTKSVVFMWIISKAWASFNYVELYNLHKNHINNLLGWGNLDMSPLSPPGSVPLVTLCNDPLQLSYFHQHQKDRCCECWASETHLWTLPFRDAWLPFLYKTDWFNIALTLMYLIHKSKTFQTALLCNWMSKLCLHRATFT